MELTPKLRQALSDCAEGLYVIDEETKQMRYVSAALAEARGADYAGKPCYRYLCGRETACDICPTLTCAQGVYTWDCFHSESGCWLSVKNCLVEEDGRLYRVGNLNIIQEAMRLSRAAVGEIYSLQTLLAQHEQRKYLLEWEASHDKMTRLFSRSQFMRDSQGLLLNGTYGALFLDINNLKTINDTMGHSIGDQAIKRVAEILEAYISQKLRPYRMGGDEFFIVMQGASRVETEDFRRTFETELDELNRQGPPDCRVAVGTAWGDQGVDDLMRLADLNMYDQKQRMKGLCEKQGPKPL